MHTSKRSKIVRLSRLMELFSVFWMVAIPLLLGGMWWFGSERFLLSGEPQYYGMPPGVAFEAGTLNAMIRFAGFAVSMLPGACVMWGLWHVARLFAGFRQLQFFSSGNVRHFRLFAVAVLLTGFVRPAASALMSLVTTLDNPAAHRFVALTAGDSELTAIFLGLFLVTIAWVMEQGQRLAEENEQFV